MSIITEDQIIEIVQGIHNILSREDGTDAECERLLRGKLTEAGCQVAEPDMGDIDYDAEREVFEKESRDCTVQGHHWEHVYPRGGYCRNCGIEY